MARRRALTGLVVVGMLVFGMTMLASCEREHTAPPAPQPATTQPATQAALPVSRELAKLGKLLSERSAPVVREIGPAAAEIALDGGARISVPAGAFNKSTRMTAVVRNLSLQHLSLKVKEAQVYSISTDAAFDQLASPVILEVPKPARNVAAVDVSDPQAKPVRIPDGPVTRVELKHFSERATAIVEWNNSVFGQINRALQGADDPLRKERDSVAADGQWVKAFFGVGEQAKRNHHAFCDEMRAMLKPLKNEKNMEFPSDYSVNDLTVFLIAADNASKMGGYYWDLVSPSLGRVHARVEAAAKSGQVSPAAVFKICIEENGNNIPKGALAAHNYLKETAYQGRLAYLDYANDLKHGVHPEQLKRTHDKMVPAMEPWGRRAAMLEPWREDPVAPEGYYDKMGPIYHIFAAMTAGLWGGHLYGSGCINGEGILRAASVGQDHSDHPKALADDCGLATAVWLLDEKYEEPPKETGFLPEDAQEIDSGFSPAKGIEQRPGTKKQMEMSGHYGNSTENTMSWYVLKEENATVAKANLAAQTKRFKTERTPSNVQDARIFRATLTDASQYSDVEALLNQTMTRAWGDKKEFIIDVSSDTLYRDVFLIRYGRMLNAKRAPDEPDPVKEVQEERAEFIKRAKAVIDKRFPPPAAKPPA